MATKGTSAKAELTKKIIDMVGDAYVDTIDNKIYINMMEAGNIVQVAVSMTCPKSPIEGTKTVKPMKAPEVGVLDWTEDTQTILGNRKKDFSPEEQDELDRLLKLVE